MKSIPFLKLVTVISFFSNISIFANDSVYFSKEELFRSENTTIKTSQNHSKITFIANVAPVITATGNQIYCPKIGKKKIVTNVNIVDPDDTSANTVYIQITSGYKKTEDILTLTGSHPTITTSWDSNTGTLKLYSPTGIPVSYTI